MNLGYKRNNAVFVPVMEHWTCCLPAWQYLRVHGSLLNHSTSVFYRLGEGILSILWEVLGRSVGCFSHCYEPFGPSVPAISWTHSCCWDPWYTQTPPKREGSNSWMLVVELTNKIQEELSTVIINRDRKPVCYLCKLGLVCSLSPNLVMVFMDKISRYCQVVEGFHLGGLRIESVLSCFPAITLTGHKNWPLLPEPFPWVFPFHRCKSSF